MKFAIRDFLTGANNESLAIGRVLGTILFVNVLLLLPGVIGGVLVLRKVDAATWFNFLTALTIYVPAMIVAVGGLIAGTAFTEPKAPTAPSSTTLTTVEKTEVT